MCDDCPYEFSDHFPIFMLLSIDLICDTYAASKSKRKVFKWSDASDFEIRMYQTEIDKLLDFKPRILSVVQITISKLQYLYHEPQAYVR